VQHKRGREDGRGGRSFYHNECRGHGNNKKEKERRQMNQQNWRGRGCDRGGHSHHSNVECYNCDKYGH